MGDSVDSDNIIEELFAEPTSQNKPKIAPTTFTDNIKSSGADIDKTTGCVDSALG